MRASGTEGVDPSYRELKTKRSRFGWLLTLAMMIVYYGFILLVAFSDLVRRYRYSFGLLSHYLNLVTGILLVWSAGQFVWHTRAAQDAKPMGSLEQASSGPALTGDVKPHFFFIVLDKYTGPRSLRSRQQFGAEAGQADRHHGLHVRDPLPAARHRACGEVEHVAG